MRLIISGGAGFIGSHLVLDWLERHPEDSVLNVDKLTYAADLSYLDPVKDHRHYAFLKIDLADRLAVKKLVREFNPEGVIHLAAESHVDNSIRDPECFIQSNIVGTFNLLEECREFWIKEPATFGSRRFHQISTDEVYGSLGESGKFLETTAFSPNSPYSASKASADHLVFSYHRTYGMNTVVTHSSNNFGPHQHDEKLIPTMIRHALKHEPLPVYGEGKNIREWLFVKDHCSAIETVFKKGRAGQHYNVGSDNEWKNLDLVHKICDVLNKKVGHGPRGDYKNLIHFVKDRPGHDFRYSLDCHRLNGELGWKPTTGFDIALNETIQWFVKKYKGSDQ